MHRRQQAAGECGKGEASLAFEAPCRMVGHRTDAIEWTENEEKTRGGQTDGQQY